ncbi:MAG: NAD(P)H-quinone oxidoreductase subunit I, chloroplastic [Candidatus Dichloromethanomonas elyunquensis]|nr:MAG: NAD(P)H-quinone oxidoreductase subunit I, chloroplastic [Candidatus Dichloromethanomonas elyunquensis]
MSHHHLKSGYQRLEERLNRFPQKAPSSKTLMKILRILFDENEAGLVAQLPIKPFGVRTASRIWKTDELSARRILDKLASRALLLDMDYDGEQRYVLPPPMAGFFEFSLMRVREDVDQKILSELFFQYLNVEEDFVKELFLGSETKLGRVFVRESVLTNENAIHILDHERASEVIKASSHIGVSLCYCRHKMQHLDRVCNAPLDVCLTFNNVAASLIKYGHARKAEVSEGLEILSLAQEHNLVQCGENVRNEVSFICNCCGCCCEGLLAVKKFGILQPLHTTNYFPVIQETCSGCGKCVRACPIEAIQLIETEIERKVRKTAEVDSSICLGCGVCVRSCSKNNIYLKRREQQIITPVNTVHRVVLMAIEKGMLHQLIFDNQALSSHRAMAAILSVILKLPPVQQVMARKQLKSVYLDRLLSNFA